MSLDQNQRLLEIGLAGMQKQASGVYRHSAAASDSAPDSASGVFAGHVRLMTTGASPISEEVFDFLRICFGATVLEGYGMTETSCVISMTLPGDATAGKLP